MYLYPNPNPAEIYFYSNPDQKLNYPYPNPNPTEIFLRKPKPNWITPTQALTKLKPPTLTLSKLKYPYPNLNHNPTVKSRTPTLTLTQPKYQKLHWR